MGVRKMNFEQLGMDKKIIRPHEDGFAIAFSGVFQANFFTGGFWFRIYGYGLNFLNRKKWPPIVRSARKQKQFFGWTCRVLKKSDIQDWDFYKNA